MVYRARDGAANVVPRGPDRPQVILRRHVPANLAAFRRWYADPEIARLARYQATPMRPEEIERFFAARVVGPDALAMAVHERATDRLIGTCAFSQLDGENGSALYHITIGEPDTWGKGFGTEATRLMVDHAFGTLACTASRSTCSSSTSAPSGPTSGRVRHRGSGARVDLARWPMVGRAGDEHARIGLGRPGGASRGRRAGRRATTGGATPPATTGRHGRTGRCRPSDLLRRTIGRWR